MSLPNRQVELIRGRLVVRELPGTRHGIRAARLAHFLSGFVQHRALGAIAAIPS